MTSAFLKSCSFMIKESNDHAAKAALRHLVQTGRVLLSSGDRMEHSGFLTLGCRLIGTGKTGIAGVGRPEQGSLI